MRSGASSPSPASATAQLDRLMRAKYGWIDAVVLTLEGRPTSVAVRLEPRP